jgi:hypothetical protein
MPSSFVQQRHQWRPAAFQRHCVCAQGRAACHWRRRPSVKGKTAQARARPSFTTAATTSSDDSNCKQDLCPRMQRGKVSRSCCAHSKQEDEPHGQPVSLPPAATYDATKTSTTAHRQRRQPPLRCTLHSRYTTNGGRQLVCSARSGEPKGFCVAPASSQQSQSPAHHWPPLQTARNINTAQHCTRWERLQSRALLSGISERWLDALADGRKCLVRRRRPRQW